MHCAIIKYPVLFNIRKTNCNEKKCKLVLLNSHNGSRAVPPCQGVEEIQQITVWDTWSWGFLVVANGGCKIMTTSTWWSRAFCKGNFCYVREIREGISKKPSIFRRFPLAIYGSFFSNLLATGPSPQALHVHVSDFPSLRFCLCHCSLFSVFVYYVPCVPSLFSLSLTIMFPAGHCSFSVFVIHMASLIFMFLVFFITKIWTYNLIQIIHTFHMLVLFFTNFIFFKIILLLLTNKAACNLIIKFYRPLQ